MTMSSGSPYRHDASSAVAVLGAGALPALPFAPVRRPEIIARLDRAMAEAGHTVLLTGPAGAGKTVLLADWTARLGARRGEVTVGWLAIPDRPARAADLWSAVAEALGLPAVLVTEGALAAPAGYAERLVEALRERATPTVLVLDDAHLLTDPMQLAALELFLAHAPITVLVAGRFDPPLHWHQLELARRLTRIGSAELAFGSRQIARVFDQHHVRLTEPEIAIVAGLTQGWAALVRMAAIYLSAHAGDRETAFTALARPAHAVADFLVVELMDTLPEDTLGFLLATAVPDRFCLPLAEDLAGPGAPRILDELLRANFPLHAVAHGDLLWYTYHPMLRAYLLAERAHTRPDLLAEGHERAARWFAAADMLRPALDHTVAVPGAPGLAGFVREHGPRMVFQGAGLPLIEAAERVPELAGDRFVRLLRAAAAVVAGEIVAAEVYLESAHASGPDAVAAPETWQAALDQAVSVGAAVAAGAAVPAGRRAPLVTGEPDLDCFTALHCAVAEVYGGEPARGTAALRHVLVTAEHRGLHRIALHARVAEAVAEGMLGRVGRMGELAGRAVACAPAGDLSSRADLATAHVVAAYAAFLRGADAARPLPVPTGEPTDSTVPAPLGHAALLRDLLDFDHAADRCVAADRIVRHAHRLLDEAPIVPATGGLVTQVVWLLLRLQAKSTAAKLVEHATEVLGRTPDTVIAAAALTEYGQRPAATVELIEPLLAERDLHPLTEVTAWLLAGVAYDRLGRGGRVHEAFERAVAAAVGENLVRPFLDVPAAVDILDRFGGRFGLYDTFVGQIRGHRGAHTATGSAHLTDTELIVLRQLPSGMTAVSIAADMGVSVNTVKTHLRGIYQKLGVNARSAAIAHARTVGLL
ncbi:LuxR C-terminal-related transcriptional regulator [Nocardia thailandica]